MIAKKFVLKNYFDGPPLQSNFELVEETIPDVLNDGEICYSAICFSVDPHIKVFSNRINVHDTIIGPQIAKVIKSRNPKYPEGSKVIAFVGGWRTLTICDPANQPKAIISGISPLPDIKGFPDSYALGALGSNGLAAYFGLLKICQPKAGETVVVTSAAGSTGSIACQIATLKGCRVIAFTSTDEKVLWLRDTLNIKFSFNYNEVHLDSILKKYAVEGVDCFFDNVGGEMACIILNNLKDRGRAALCGANSEYIRKCNASSVKIPFDFSAIISKQIKMEGFIVSRWVNEFPEAIKQLAQWINEEKIKIQEVQIDGFENLPQAFIDLFEGKKYGKMIVNA